MQIGAEARARLDQPKGLAECRYHAPWAGSTSKAETGVITADVDGITDGAGY